jgi:hypothetical protein
MKYVVYVLFGVILFAATLPSATVASAASARQLFTAPSENGKIERLDLKAGELVIDDTLFRLSNSVAVYTYRGFQTTADSLRRGMRVAFNVAEDGSGARFVSAIWILSKK